MTDKREHGCPYLPYEGCNKQEPMALRESFDYHRGHQRGYSDGYTQGLTDAMKHYEEALILASANRPVQILVPKGSVLMRELDLTKDKEDSPHPLR